MDETIVSSSENAIPLKIAVLGQSMVGKSALTFRFINNKFPTEHDTTIEDSYSIPAKIDDIHCQLEILDTAGQDDYQSMLETWINFGSCFLLVYSIDSPESFVEAKKKYEKVALIKGKDIFTCILVGNKCDLSDDLRKVSKSEAEEFAQSRNIPFLECSALNTINVKESFIKVAHDYLEKVQKHKRGGANGLCGCNII